MAGCAAVPERPAVEDREVEWQSRQAALRHLVAWELRGRLALRTDEEGANASVRWKHEGDRNQVDLAGPFGGGRVRVTQDVNGAELRDAGGKIYRDAMLGDLLARVTGWRLPIESLRYWIVGLPEPNAAQRRTLDAWGRLQTLAQSGWEVQFLEYTTQGAFEVPRRLFIKRANSAGDDRLIEARFVIDSWTIGESVAAY
jgi:outer membrane lipoprotein LolB